jgi:hypothetical protein
LLPASAQGINVKTEVLMSFREAKEAFRDAQSHLDPKSEPVLYDLALGLRLLTEAIEREMTELRTRIDQRPENRSD